MAVFLPAAAARRQRGISVFGMVVVAIVVALMALLIIKVVPAVNEYFTIERTVKKIMQDGQTSAISIRQAFDKQKEVEYSIQSLRGADLQVEQTGADRFSVNYAYDKEIELFNPVFLVIKFKGQAKN